jgi:ABC-type multidrug transport system fused ATPase/permease subunit
MWAFTRTLPARYQRGIGITAVVALIGAGLDTLALGLLIPTIERVVEVSTSAGESQAVQWIENLFDLVGLDFTLGWMLFVILIASALRSVMMLTQAWVGTHFQAQYEAELKRTVFASVMGARWQFFLNQRTGYLNNLLIMETNRAAMAYGLLNGAVGAIINIAIYLGVAFALSWQLTLVTLATMLVLMSVFSVLTNVAKRLGEQATDVNNDMAAELNEAISGAKIIKSESLQKSIGSRLERVIARRARIDLLIGINNGVFASTTELVFFGVMIVGVLFASRVVDLPAATVLLFALLFFRMYQRGRIFQSSLVEGNGRLPGAWAIKNMVSEATAEAESTEGASFEGLKTGLEFNDVSFAYDSRVMVLDGVSFKVPAGSVVALVGRSGAGKTSIIDLTIGLLQPTSGQVLVDGVPLDSVNPAEWRSRLAYVSQETILFHDSVYGNISWGRESATEEDVYEAARMAEAESFIKELPDGYDTVVGDRGTRLSGGQRQRLALARALVRKPDLLILDEATSELDTRSESKIQENLESLRGRTTVLIAAHRLSTILSADAICVFENGVIQEMGTAEDLIAKRGIFHSMYQAGADVDSAVADRPEPTDS